MECWNSLMLPVSWCSIEKANHTRVVVAVVHLEPACKRERSQAEPTVLTKENATIVDVVIIMEEKKPIIARVMTLINQSKASTVVYVSIKKR
uniref:Uncharacterized protein n=1 Tax=Glossina pallidipes TaxID=7398 RepID=A0A1B0AEF8_GLOPL